MAGHRSIRFAPEQLGLPVVPIINNFRLYGDGRVLKDFDTREHAERASEFYFDHGIAFSFRIEPILPN